MRGCKTPEGKRWKGAGLSEMESFICGNVTAPVACGGGEDEAALGENNNYYKRL